MRVLVTGSRGQLGSDFIGLLADRGDAVTGLDRPEIDITQPSPVAAALTLFEPDVVINCAAGTAVDDAESQEAVAQLVNGQGPRVLAKACRDTDAWLVQVAKDYVFAGDVSSPYLGHAPTSPTSAYGRTKLAGELAVRKVLSHAPYIVRTAWLYSVAGNNFVTTILNAQRQRETVSVVTDQFGKPTYARDLARQIIALLDARPPAGTFHGTNCGVASRF